jgi:predicted transcriptional regulator
MKNWNTLKEKWMTDPDFKAGYDALEPEHQLARSLIEARIARKMTQTELARKAGVSQSVIARLESGTQDPRYTTIARIAAALERRIELVG